MMFFLFRIDLFPNCTEMAIFLKDAVQESVYTGLYISIPCATSPRVLRYFVSLERGLMIPF